MRGLEPRALAAAFIAGGATVMQVRQKSGRSGVLLTQSRDIVADSAAAGAGVIVNDRSDIALLARAVGVHVGQTDLPPSVVRSIVGSGTVIGVSTHTKAQVDEALAGTANYVAVGPVFRTLTKETGYEPQGLDLVRYAAGRGKPVVAIGGISIDNARDVIAAGATSVAVISDLLATGDPASRVHEYLASLA